MTNKYLPMTPLYSYILCHFLYNSPLMEFQNMLSILKMFFFLFLDRFFNAPNTFACGLQNIIGFQKLNRNSFMEKVSTLLMLLGSRLSLGQGKITVTTLLNLVNSISYLKYYYILQQQFCWFWIGTWFYIFYIEFNHKWNFLVLTNIMGQIIGLTHKIYIYVTYHH